MDTIYPSFQASLKCAKSLIDTLGEDIVVKVLDLDTIVATLTKNLSVQESVPPLLFSTNGGFGTHNPSLCQ